MQRRLKVLYAEDDTVIAELAMMALEEHDLFEIAHCETGREAVDMFTSFEPDILLLDVMMPAMSGPEALKEIRNLPGGLTVNVAFMTAKIQEHERGEYKRLGVAKIISKPFNPLSLSAELLALGERSDAMEQPVRPLA